jgi:hypothetical protein
VTLVLQAVDVDGPSRWRWVRWPLELAHAGGRPLAARGDVSLVSVLALRRERYELGKLIRRIAAKRGRLVELTVVQYGVTRQKLAEIADTGDGWDVLHLSGHGGPGAFLLEHADGSPDLVNVADLVEMLHPAKRRVKLAVVSACESAAAAMARASTALAAESGRTSVLLHGMAGAGKTSCAVELAYRHRDSFAAVAFWQAPTREDQWEGALAGLAVTLEAQLGRYRFAMTGHIGSVQELTAFLPRLRQLLSEQGLLLVLDNLETLLTAEGTWRDPRWDPLIAALTSHDGESRVIMTSRTAPVGLEPSVLVLPVHALSLEESVALVRELPNLRGLLHAGDMPVRAPASGAAALDRDRVRRVLRVVQGHPKLMELADAAAADRARLDAQLAAAEDAAAGLGLEAFFRDGDSTLDPHQFLDALTGWTTNALDVLPEDARLMAQFVACLEDSDRRSGVIEIVWPVLLRRLDRPGDPPAPGPLLDTLATVALVQPEGGAPVTYRMHPGVAAARGGGRGAQRPGGGREPRRRPVPAAPRRLGHRRRPARTRPHSG